MIESPHGLDGEARPTGRAVVTRWSLVLASGQPRLVASRLDVAALCERSVFPVYAWWRAGGMESIQAHHAAIGFLRELVLRATRDALPLAPRNFRLFLHEALAGSISTVSIMAGGESDALACDTRFPRDGHADLQSRHAMDHAYAKALIHRAHDRLGVEAAQTQHERLFAALIPYLAKEPPHAVLEALAFEHGMRPMLIAHALERLRQRFRELVDGEVADTVVDADELVVERRALLMILSRWQ